MRNLSAFKDQGLILLGSSRKSWIDDLCDAPPQATDWEVLLPRPLLPHGEVIRVHSVKRPPKLHVARNSLYPQIIHTKTEAMGKIKLQGIEVRVRIGLLEEEQFAPQDLYVSLELSYDFSSIRESDEITDGIDYREIVEFVRQFSNAYDGKTLERFAHLLAVELKEKFDFSKVRLSVDKPRYVKKLGLREIRVEVERWRLPWAWSESGGPQGNLRACPGSTVGIFRNHFGFQALPLQTLWLLRPTSVRQCRSQNLNGLASARVAEPTAISGGNPRQKGHP